MRVLSIVLAGVVAMSLQEVVAARPEELVAHPVSENQRGHENIEWSTSYAYHLTDEKKALPRVLLVGDSICRGYQGGVSAALEGKMTVTYWVSSYCVTSPCYLKFLSLYLDEAQYSVIHFNNGCHSFSTSNEDWERGLRAAFALIRSKQPNAKLVWATTTPNKDKKRNGRVVELNAIAARVIGEFGNVGVDDLFASMDPLDRAANWGDDFHFKAGAVSEQVRQVVAACLCAGHVDPLPRGVTVNGRVVNDVEWRHEADGDAVRYRLPQGKRVIASEDTVWTLPEDARCWYQIGVGSYETAYSSSRVKDVPKDKVLALPITFKLADGSYRLITEANLVDYTDLAVVYEGEGRFRAVYHAEKGPFEQTGADTTPWRVTIKAKNLNELYNCDLVRRLCPEPTNEKSKALYNPGRSIWQWLPAGDPVYAEQRDWYDKTAALGFEYYLIDDGWKNWRDGEKDQWACLKSAIDYGKSVGVKTAMWVDSKEMPTEEKRRAYLKKVVEAGAVGIKIDFMPPCDSKWCKWYEETLADTAELGLFVDFHGAVKPTGREKTWPHELAREAIRGHEWHMTRFNRVLPPEHDAILPFCRLVQGHGDYTPVVFQKDQLIHFTWPRQMAQGIIMSAPFLCLGDYPQNYLDSPMVEVIKALPATYDETIVLPGSEIGECVALARRAGSRWFIGVENGVAETKLDLPLSFLSSGRWKLIGFSDDPTEKLDACVREEKEVDCEDHLKLTIRLCGGYVAMVTKK